MPEDTTTQDSLDARTLLVQDLYNDPAARGYIQQAIVTKYPAAKARIPELAIQDAIAPALEEIRKEREALAVDRAKTEGQRKLEEARRDLIDRRLATRDEIPAIEQLMTDRLIGTHEDAVLRYRETQRVAEPRSIPDYRWQVPGVKGAGGDYFKGINEDRRSWFLDKAHEIHSDFARDPRAAEAKWGQ